MTEGAKDRIPPAKEIVRAIPKSLEPNAKDGPRFPTITKEEAIELAKAGWERIGVIVLLRNPQGQVLVVVHGPGNPKVPENMMGLISETCKIEADGLEQPLAAISRLFTEELELTLEEIKSLNLQAVRHGAWQNAAFPLGGNRDALGLVVVLEADQSSVDTIIRRGAQLSPRSEIKYVSFMYPDPLAHRAPVTENFRPGITDAVIAALEDLTTNLPKSRVDFPAPRKPSSRATEDLKDLLPQ